MIDYATDGLFDSQIQLLPSICRLKESSETLNRLSVLKLFIEADVNCIDGFHEKTQASVLSFPFLKDLIVV